MVGVCASVPLSILALCTRAGAPADVQTQAKAPAETEDALVCIGFPTLAPVVCKTAS